MSAITRRSSVLTAVWFAALVSVAAIARQASPPAPTDAPQQRLDANGDGAIDRDEAANAPRLAEQFEQLDADHDGRLGPDERPQRGGGGRGDANGKLRALDTDGDGRIDRDEAAAKPDVAQRFEQLDANRDGFLERSDFQARKARSRGECFAQADADGNGQLSRGEFDAASAQCHPQGGKRDSMRGGDGDMPESPPSTG